MAILRKKNARTVNEMYLGVFVPKYISEFLTLYALYHEVPKSAVTRKALNLWYKNVIVEDLSKFDLIEKLAKKLHLKWRYPPGRRMNFNTFISSLEIELKNKGIEKGDINLLIKILKDEKENGDKEE